MPKQNVERVFTRRSFILFLLLAPAAILTLIAIILATQYKQLQSVVSSKPVVSAYSWDEAGRARVGAIAGSLRDFATGKGSDTLRLTASDLNLLAAASPVVQKQRLYFRISALDSLLLVESTQSIEDQNRKLSWIFKKVIPLEFQYLNARLEGLPQWKEGRLEFAAERGFLNGSKVPRAALLKRAGISPKDFVDSTGLPLYQALLSRLDSTYYADGSV